MKKVYYFSTYDTDLVQDANQAYRLSPDFQWIRRDIAAQLAAPIVSSLAKIFGYGYNKLILRQSFANLKVLKPYRGQGFFLYANHTQPVGDVFLPMLAGGALHYYVICAAANLGVPIIGPLLPYGGAMPIPPQIHRLPQLLRAVQEHIAQHDFITIYPEAHVWPYYTGIRPFSDAAFHFPIITKAPVFVMTNTYQRAHHGKRPRMITYFDGPFFPDKGLARKERQHHLKIKVEHAMRRRAMLSNVEYVKYIQQKKGDKA